MPQICHRHCPGGGKGGLLSYVIAAVIVLAVLGPTLNRLLSELVAWAIATALVLGIAMIGTLVYQLRRNRVRLSSRAEVDKAVLALAEPPRKSLPAARKAITGAYVITDATVTRDPARMPIKRDGTVTR